MFSNIIFVSWALIKPHSLQMLYVFLSLQLRCLFSYSWMRLVYLPPSFSCKCFFFYKIIPLLQFYEPNPYSACYYFIYKVHGFFYYMMCECLLFICLRFYIFPYPCSFSYLCFFLCCNQHHKFSLPLSTMVAASNRQQAPVSVNYIFNLWSCSLQWTSGQLKMQGG